MAKTVKLLSNYSEFFFFFFSQCESFLGHTDSSAVTNPKPYFPGRVMRLCGDSCL